MDDYLTFASEQEAMDYLVTEPGKHGPDCRRNMAGLAVEPVRIRRVGHPDAKGGGWLWVLQASKPTDDPKDIIYIRLDGFRRTDTDAVDMDR
jgi:hypothetical protein